MKRIATRNATRITIFVVLGQKMSSPAIACAVTSGTAPSKAPEKPTATGSAPSIATDRQKPVDLESTSRVKLEAKKPAQLVVTESGKPAQTVTLDRTITIGRSPANELVLAEAKVSRQHAQIQVLGDKYVLLDLESSNGTFIGDKKITEHLLSPGDEIRIGKTTLVFKQS